MALLKIVREQNPREIAVTVLGRRDGTKGKYVEDLLEQALAEALLSPPDRRLCQELVYGVVRWQGTLDWLIARKTQNRVQKADLQNLLRLGLYQIFWLERIPPHAAVHQTVQIARERGFGPQSGFVNALLRGYLRESIETRETLQKLKSAELATGFSHPAWLVERWQSRWGNEKTTRLLEWNNCPPRTYARINTLKVTPGTLLEKWRAENVEYDFVRGDWFGENTVFELKAHPPLHRLSSFKEGLFYIQDPSTLLAVAELDPKTGEAVLDLCAAPGGKMSCIAQIMGNDGALTACDVSPERLELIRQNCARLGLGSVQVVLTAELPAIPPATPLRDPQRDAAGRSHGRFDRILVDAPCSNTGVVRRRVDLRWRIRPEEIARLRRVQMDLLFQAARRLKRGGVLVYSTCSLEPEENESVREEFVRSHPGFILERERQLTPFNDNVDGAYVARIRRET